MSLRINDEAPNFTAETTQGTINFHDWIGNGWAVLFSHPKDFTPVCTTELGYMAGLKSEFDKRNCKILGLSVDPVTDHTRWAKDIEETSGHSVTYPMVGDPELKVAMLYDMLPADAGTTSQGRTAANNATVRSVFVIGPDKKIKTMLTYPMSTGRNFDEVLRILELGAADREAPDRDAGQLEAGRRRHHRRRRCRTRRRSSAIRAGSARRSRICATCRSRKADPSPERAAGAGPHGPAPKCPDPAPAAAVRPTTPRRWSAPRAASRSWSPHSHHPER